MVRRVNSRAAGVPDAPDCRGDSRAAIITIGDRTDSLGVADQGVVFIHCPDRANGSVCQISPRRGGATYFVSEICFVVTGGSGTDVVGGSGRGSAIVRGGCSGDGSSRVLRAAEGGVRRIGLSGGELWL